MNAVVATIGGIDYVAGLNGSLVPYVAPEVEYVVVNGVNYVEQPDGTLVPAGAIPVAQVKPASNTRANRKATRAPASPKTPETRTAKVLPDVWTSKSAWKGMEPSGAMLWRARSCGVPAGVIVKADKLALSQAIGAALVKSGSVKSAVTE